jgi:hypothetical protein
MATQTGILTGRMTRRAMQVRPNQAGVFDVKENQFLQITDLIGKQVAVMTLLNLHDDGEFLSTAHTRAINRSLMLLKEHGIYSNRRNKMFTIIEDSVGRHDILLPACDPRSYLDDYGVEQHNNVIDNYLKAGQKFELTRERIPLDTVNWFMNVAIKARGELEVREPLSGRNDQVLLKANMDLLVMIAASPQDQNATNGFRPTDILIRVYM